MQIVVFRCLALFCVVLLFCDIVQYVCVSGVCVCKLLFYVVWRCCALFWVSLIPFIMRMCVVSVCVSIVVFTLFDVVLRCVTVLDVVVLRITLILI